MQRTPEWFAKRAGKFTGSRFAQLMARTRGGKPTASRANLITTLAIERIIGGCVDTYQSPAMIKGILREPEAIEAYEDDQICAVEYVDFIDHPSLEFVGVSPDGLVGEDGMVEVKCPSAAAKHYDALRYGSHVKEYWWQIQGQLWVAQRAWNDAVSYCPEFEGLALAISRVERDNDAISELEAACIEAEAEVQEQVDWFRRKRQSAA